MATRFGVHLPNFGPYGDARVLADLAVLAEDSGWDGFFLWDHLLFCEHDQNPHVDPWVALTAVAAATSTIKIGALVTPLARRRPWELARQSVSLHNYSGGRLVLGVGLGDPTEWDFRFFGDETDPRVRAEKLDEGLDIVQGLWSGEQFGFTGTHYTLEPMTFLPAPVSPIPIWVAGTWPRTRPFRRAARYDGAFPLGGAALGEWALRDLRDFIRSLRGPSDDDFELIVSGTTDPHAEIGSDIRGVLDVASWWLEEINPLRFGLGWEALGEEWDEQALRTRIAAGPPSF